jgi:hypothetical protein
VDGGIIGGPAWGPGTVLYLAGTQTGRIVNCFSAGPLQTKVLGSEIGKASALKMCYAAYSKGTTALLAAILATAGQLNVRSALEAQWDADEPGFSEKVRQRTRRVTAKAWRFAGEMDEIAATFHAAGLPGGFYGAAADVYRRMEAFKDAPEMPELDVVLNRLLGK